MTAQLGRRRMGHDVEFPFTPCSVDIEEYSYSYLACDWQKGTGQASGTKSADADAESAKAQTPSQVPDDSLSCIWLFRPVWAIPA